VSETQQLPKCMKICFLALYNTTNEIANEIQKEKGCCNPLLPHLKEVVLLVLKYFFFFFPILWNILFSEINSSFFLHSG
jgi:hypothetical protein